MVTFSVIVPSKGRPTLQATLASVAPQLVDGDELLVQRRDCPHGNRARESAIGRAEGSHLLFIDDDDAYLPGALTTIRAACDADPDCVHIFKMRYPDGMELWRQPSVYCGNVGSPMFAVPNQPGRLGCWGDAYEGDFHFLAGTLAARGDQPVFHDQVVALVRPSPAEAGAPV